MSRKWIFSGTGGRGLDNRNKGKIREFLTEHHSEITSVVERNFSIYGSERMNGSIRYFVTPIAGRLEESFENVRTSLREKGLLGTVVEEKGETILYVFKAPEKKRRSLRWNILLFIATLITTVWAGTVIWASYVGYESNLPGALGSILQIFEVLSHPKFLLHGGLSFAIPLLAILGVHESSHYIASKKNKIDASLPYFIPIPPLIGMLGTFGAFITIKEPLPSKKSLVQIGAAGPIGGMIIAIPVTIIGFILSVNYPGAPMSTGTHQTWVLGEPLLYRFIGSFFSVAESKALHPTAFAGWVGILVTAFNLLPAGQLDGGHIARGLFGKKAKYFSYLSVIALLIMGLWFPGWLIFALLILFIGAKHPPPLNDISPLKTKDKVIGIFSIILLVLCFIPIPLQVVEMETPGPDLSLTTSDPQLAVYKGKEAKFHIVANNTGEGNGDFRFEIAVEYGRIENVNISALSLWNVSVSYPTSKDIAKDHYLDLMNFKRNEKIWHFTTEIPGNKAKYINLTFNASPALPYNSQLKLNITGREKELSGINDHLVVEAEVATLELFTPKQHRKVLVEEGVPNIANFKVTATNIGESRASFVFDQHVEEQGGREIGPEGWRTWLNGSSTFELEPGEKKTFWLRAQPPLNVPGDKTTGSIELRGRTLVDGENVTVSLRISVIVEYVNGPL